VPHGATSNGMDGSAPGKTSDVSAAAQTPANTRRRLGLSTGVLPRSSMHANRHHWERLALKLGLDFRACLAGTTHGLMRDR